MGCRAPVTVFQHSSFLAHAFLTNFDLAFEPLGLGYYLVTNFGSE